MRVVYSYYVLDIVHHGHLNHMKNAKAAAGKDGISVVGILTKEAVLEKKPKKPILSFDERIELAHAIKYNDFVVAQDTYSPLPNIKRIRPDIVMESDSHDSKEVQAIVDYLEHTGGCVIVNPYYPFISSSKIKLRISGDIDSIPNEVKNMNMKRREKVEKVEGAEDSMNENKNIIWGTDKQE